MAAFRCCPRLLVAGLVLTAAGPAFAESRTELYAVFAGPTLLGDPALEPPPSFSALTSSRSETESRLQLALGTEAPGFLRGVRTAANLRVEVPLLSPSAESLALHDVSSSLAIAWQATRRVELELRAFPFDTDYVRLGYLHSLSWGGTDRSRRESVFLAQAGGAPGVLASVRTHRLALFAGLKRANLRDPVGATDALFGALGGASVEPTRALRLDLGFGFFERPPLGSGFRSSEHVEGASLRVVYRDGPTEPELAVEPFRRPSLREEAAGLAAESAEGWAVALEGVALVERQPLSGTAAQSRLMLGPAASLYGSLRRGVWAGHGALGWRSLRFVLRNERPVLGAASTSTREQAELGAWIGGSILLRPAELVPSAELGVVQPAALQTASPFAGLSQTYVAGPRGLEPLPTGAAQLPVFMGRLALRFQASRVVGLALLGDYQRNPNRTRFAAAAGTSARVFANPDSLSVRVAAQARF
jgi:hypothetical protein